MKDHMLSCQVHINGTLPYNYNSNSGAFISDASIPFLNPEGGFLLHSKVPTLQRYYLSLFTEHASIFIIFLSVYWTLKVLFFTLHPATGIFLFSWRFYLFFLHGCSIGTFFFFFIWVHLTPEGFYFFLQLQDAMCIYELSTCTHRRFSWVLSFSLSLFTMPLACVLLNNPACTGLLEGFYFFFPFTMPWALPHFSWRFSFFPSFSNAA